MSDIRETEKIIEELENCFVGHDEYILGLLAELRKSRDEDLNKAVQEEREACARILEAKNTYCYTSAQLAEAIRQRGKK